MSETWCFRKGTALVSVALGVLWLLSLAATPALSQTLGKTPARVKGAAAATNAKNDIGTNLGGTGEIAARLRGEPIYRNKLNSAELAKARQEVFQLEQRLLRERVIARLAQAKPKEFGIRPVRVSEKEIRDVYDKAGLKGRGTLESYRVRIHTYVLRQKTAARQGDLFERAIRKGYLENFLKAPPPFLLRLAPVNRKASTRGNPAAPIHMVEFSDFQCPFCNRVRGTLAAVLKKYKGEVKLVYRHLPLEEIHKEAVAAAVASECAAEQGRFWPYHDGIFESRSGMSDSALLAIAQRKGVRNLKKFKACTASNRYRSLVDGDIKAANALGIRGTPGFFIGTIGEDGMLEGETLSGAQPLENFTAIIERVRARRSR